MREILFRGKRIDDNRWVEGGIMRKFHPNFPHESVRDFFFQKENCYVICANNRDIFVAQNTIGQYTGLNANGKKIFEGDIVATPKYNGVVVYGTGCYCIKHGNNSPAIDIVMNDFDVYVIGNIYDNPELLKGE